MADRRERKIPLGLSSYKEIIREGYYYIDKTKYIQILEESNTKFPILLRPRRFGKTLFADMLASYYDIKEKDSFEELFGATYIGGKKTILANSYHVLRLNLSGLDARNAGKLEYSFGAYVKEEIRNFISYYGLESMELRNEDDLIVYLNHFLSRLRNTACKKLYIIIDEYDHFANALLSSREEFENAVGKDGFIRNFYEVLKKHTTYVLDRIFITGVTSLTLDSLTSGFNISKNISNREEMNGALGFTQAEVAELAEYMQIPDQEKTLGILKENYDGYLFSNRAAERIYNSNMVLYYMDEYQNSGEQPEELADPNITGDYTKLAAMLDLYTDAAEKETVLQTLMANESVTGKLVTSFSLVSEFSRDHFLSLLYYLGLLTLDKGMPGKYQFKTPNHVIRDIFYDYYFLYLKDALSITDTMVYDALAQFEKNGDMNPLISMVENMIGESTKNNNRYMIHFRENTLQTLFYLILRQSNKYNVRMEYEAENKYADIFYWPAQGGLQYVMELKYISQSRYDNDRGLLDKAITEAQQQILAEIKVLGNTKGAVIVFVGKTCGYSKIIV